MLGTAFNVEAYDAAGDVDQGGAAVEVVVVEGRVVLRAAEADAAAGAVLTPGERGRLRTATAAGAAQVDVARVDPGDYVAWRSGPLVFPGTPHHALARERARWYDVDVLLAPGTPATLRLDAAFESEPLPEVLRTIATALDLTYRHTGRRVVFARP